MFWGWLRAKLAPGKEAMIIESVKVELRLQVFSDGQWGTVSTQSGHISDESSYIRELEHARDSWQAAGVFPASSKWRIVREQPNGGFSVG
jgi:hypothetical protein